MYTKPLDNYYAVVGLVLWHLNLSIMASERSFKTINEKFSTLMSTNQKWETLTLSACNNGLHITWAEKLLAKPYELFDYCLLSGPLLGGS